MQMIFTIIENSPYFILFQNSYEWVIWGVLLSILLIVIIRNWHIRIPKQRNEQTLVLFFLITLPICAFVFGVRPIGTYLQPLPGLPIEPQAPALMFLAVLPLLYWAGTSGKSLAILAGLIIGGLNGFWESHSLMTPIEYGFIGLTMAIFLRQDYRTYFYKFVRHPFGCAITAAILTSPLYVFSTFLTTQGSLPVKLDFAFTQTYLLILVRAGEIIFAGLIAEVLYLLRIGRWYRPLKVIPSPAESSIQIRFFNRIAPFLLLLLIGLMAGDWLIAGNAARNLLEDRLESTASIAAKNLPYFMETGQNLLLDLADPDLVGRDQDQVQAALAEKLRVVPFFRQLFLFDAEGNAIAGYPLNSLEEIQPAREEIAGIKFARDGVLIQTYTIDPWLNHQSAQISMIAGIQDKNGDLLGVLLGRTDLSSNPYTQPAIQALNEINIAGGEGMIVDENNRIIYHPISSLVMSEYIGTLPDQPGFSENLSMDGTQSYVYYYPVAGRPWKVLLSVPIAQSQQIALDIAIPLFVLIVIFSVVVSLSLRFGLRSVTSSLNLLATEASTIADGDLNYTLRSHNEDEVGKFSQSFERMRITLKRRIEELDGLLKVSEGVARHINAEDSIERILEIALLQGADSVRILLIDQQENNESTHKIRSFSAGELANDFAALDQQILDMMALEDQIIISNTNRMRRLKLMPMKHKPGALIALPLRMEDAYYGVLWLGFKSSRTFDAEQVQFLNTLSNHASIAAANASLFSRAVIGRQRLEAVLRATPEAVLVINEDKKVILMNPAALKVEGLIQKAEVDCPIEQVIKNPEIKKILLDSPASPFDSSYEVNMPNGHSYDVTLSPVWISEEIPAGVVCIMRDITRYKQQDLMKSDFVATVSHDLRVPLSMMRGYATMLPMVGEINEQQRDYMEKIQASIERMIKLTHNVLNVQRIESGMALDIKEIDPGKIVEMVNQILAPQTTQKKIDLSYEIKLLHDNEQIRLIEADADLLQQAIYNLVENAIKFSPVKGRVRVVYEELDQEALFSVEDNGIGIAPLDLKGIFEHQPQRGSSDGDEDSGSGYGLNIVKSIAMRHNGTVWVESTLGKGSTFYLRIPRVQI
ncbi:MAG: GAF domain-containing protein [Anaerolineaceae bacterium]|nr:GAF domain-containing protein [Anaerolineaceae bacterium]